jgi:hypothetical protein
MKSVLGFALFLAAVASSPAAADDRLVRFNGGIGETPVSTVNPATGLATANVVNGVGPGGQPWVIARLTADVRADGRITVDGRGLLLAGGNGIGTNGGQSVEARLFCGGVAHDTGLVALEANGDFRIDDVLTGLPLPGTCDNPVLLIVNAGGRWFAAGIVER